MLIMLKQGNHASNMLGKSSGLNQHYEEKVRPCIDLVDTLRSLGVEKDLNLPASAVIGIVTRCPLVLKRKKITKGNNWHGVLSYKKQEKKLKDPAEIENATILAGKGEGISHDMITLEIQSSDVPDLTLIDLPGIARIATGNQPVDIEEQIKGLIEKLIKRQETISLVVVPANIDIATTEALRMASKVDSTGQRTLGILTKPDLVDKGMEETVIKTVNNQEIPLKKGYMIVKCRGQQDINEKLDLVQALEKERQFFDGHSHFRSLLEDRKATIPLLAERLTKELVEHIAKTLPQLQKQLQMKLEKTSEDLKTLGDGVPLDENEKSNFLIMKIRQFNDALEGVKRAEEDLKTSDTRVFSKIRWEFGKWKLALDSKAIKSEFLITFNDILHKLNSHFNAFSHLLRAAKDPIEDFLEEQVQKAEEKIHSQFKMEKIVYSQDELYSSQLNIVKQKSLSGYGLKASFVNADVREMAYHLTSYLKITCDRLANQIPLIVQYHMVDQYISQLQNAMLAMIGGKNPGMLLREDSGVALKRKELKERLERLKKAVDIKSKLSLLI
uniref:Interferon-induced GTP-binding protein Mx n=1 Tax=Sinocyclocheilus anshuiensis TaxID=1608454 RepID=A0A671NFU7_9TELE